MSLMTNWLVHNDFENCFIILISLILILDCVEVTKVCWIVLKCVKSVAKFKSVVALPMTYVFKGSLVFNNLRKYCDLCVHGFHFPGKHVCLNRWILQWRHNERDGVSNHQHHHCLLNRLFRSRSKKTSKLRVNGLCAGNSPETGEFHAQMASNGENVSIWWRHHVPVWNSRDPNSVNMPSADGLTLDGARLSAGTVLTF